MSHRATPIQPDVTVGPPQPATQPSENTSEPTTPPRTDGRLAIQAEKLRINALTQAVRFGSSKPSVSPRGIGILIGSAIIGLLLLGGTVGLSALLQWFMNR